MSQIIAVDIGGTHIRMAVYEPNSTKPLSHKRTKTLTSQPGGFHRLWHAVQDFWHKSIAAIAYGNAIARYVKEQIDAGQKSTLHASRHPDLSTVQIADAALKGDALAISAFERAGHYLGIAVANYLAIFDPSILVFGGGVSQVGDLLFKPFEESLRKHVFHPHYLDDLVITKAALGDDAGLLGALALARMMAK